MVKKTITILLVFCSSVLAQDAATYTVGATARTYSTYTAAEAAHDQDLVAADSILTFEGYDDADLVENLAIAGWTSDATRYATWTVAAGERHDGTRGTGVTINPSSSGHCIEISSSFHRVEYIELTGVHGSSDEGVRINTGVSNVALKWLLIYDLDNVDTHDGIYTGNWNITNLLIEGCIIIDCDRAGIHAQNFSGSNTQTILIKHTTVLGGNKSSTSDNDFGGIVNRAELNGTNTITCDNVIVMNTNTTADFQSKGGGGTETWAGTFNMSEDASADEGGMSSGVLSKTYADQFTLTTANAEDIHLKAGNDAEDAGHTVTLQTAEDFEGDSIPQNSVHDIGADEVVPAGAAIRKRNIIIL